MSGGSATVLLVGGGSGGHIYPNMAVAERLAEKGVGVIPHYVVSERAVDARVCEGLGAGWSAVPAAPPSVRPGGAWRFWTGWRGTAAGVRRLLEEHDAAGSPVRAVVATGGFVSAAVVAAVKRWIPGMPTALVSLDATAGRANRWAARKADTVFSAYAGGGLRDAEVIGYPLRRAVVKAGEAGPGDGRVLLVFGGSQGGGTINRAMMELAGMAEAKKLLRGWRVVHVTGEADEAAVRAAYEEAGMDAEVLAFCGEMGALWGRAELAICRAGGGSVAEAWANAVPSVFLPYPFHKDEHQRLNALPMVNAGGAVLMKDAVDARLNASALVGQLRALIGNADRLQGMRRALRDRPMEDGASVIADWVAERLA
ncbi:MAG: UDP-N-acetylglucosamine--N-acetylmuramyl-(pentapeptide) pyrophosphoryl-undecaprenol N-acetylglucosamine transferase [Planctomycetota bacterium]